MSSPSVSVFALVYGQSGLGKSTDMAATFPNALFVARPGGMQSAQSFLGIGVAEAHVRTLEEVINLIGYAKQRGHDAIVVDDLSLLAESTERDLDATMATEGNRNKFAKYNVLNGLAASLREQGRFAGIHFACNALRTILTAGGYTLSRAPGLEWQNDVALAVAQKAADGQETADIVALLWPKLVGNAGFDPRHVAWAIRDGLASAELSAATTDRFKNLFDLTSPEPAISAVFGA